MTPLPILLALVPISVGFRYLLKQGEAAKLIGIKLANRDCLAVNKYGFETAVSPPESNKWFFLSLALLLAGVAWLGIGFGWQFALAGVFVMVASGIFAQL